ncbi:MAG: mannitol dehydrogenase family protein [Spirochaetaceae bacterium]|jgi:fructuronate reductase|nr:mannitol dehydrogenase family protein [Spirochaetaceae bacterium]
MLIINKKNVIKHKADFEKAGVKTGNIDIDALATRTAENPRWVHFGAGNLFKAYHAVLAQRLIEDGLMDTGIIALVPNDFSSIEKLYTKNDNLFLQVVMKANGALDKRIIAAATHFVAANPADSKAWNFIKTVFAKPSLQMVTITITEKGHDLKTMDGAFKPEILKEFDDGPNAPLHAMTKLTSLLWERYTKCAQPIAVLSTDNFSHNGDKLKNAILVVAKEWENRGKTDAGFTAYLSDPQKVSFPLSMIDKITPYASETVQKQLKKDGLDGMDIVKSPHGSSTALFVNTEEAEYLVVEDNFPNGRPPLEKAGVYFTTREKVDMVERMKVCTCLNPLHTALAIFGCLLGYTSISAEMRDKDLTSLVHNIGYDEGMQVVTDPGIIKPSQFIHEVLTVRLPNPNIPDTPQRIATDTSQKMAIRFGETIKAYKDSSSLNISNLKLIPMVIAAWCRYLLGIDDEGNAFTISPDPLLSELKEKLSGITLGSTEGVEGKLKPILSNENIFGVDLYKAGIGEKIENYFKQFLERPGAVRETLHENVI